MLSRNDFELSDGKWIDLKEPTRDDFRKLATELKIPKRVLDNSLAPEHLPTFEIDNDDLTIFLRVIDPTKKVSGVSVQDLTTKIAFFIHQNRLITIHRMDPVFLEEARQKTKNGELKTVLEVVKFLVIKSLDTFSTALDELEVKTEDFEEKIFSSKKYRTLIREGYFLKRKATAYRKVLKFSQDILRGVLSRYPEMEHDLLGSKEILDRNLFYTDELLENISGLLNLHISLSSQKTNEASFKTNEVMRVLTVFSLFFLPLNFIVGLYGMNFTNMPELNWDYGYPVIVGFMIVMSSGIYLWVHKKGWLKSPDEVTEKLPN
ncbi:MAG: hypothetical protein L6Q33_11705 [Bacteriovoracaceae bacterium]|nr:hypothetical protein [Bacteriovoracaceae bacterium]